jgi:hypothetical protein
MASEVKVNKISPASGTSFTLGDSGDTFTVPSGVTLQNNGTADGFGAVDWQTSDIKTSTFTAVAGKGYFVNTTGGAITVNLPAGSAGAQIGLLDYAGTWDTNNCTVAANGSEKIQASTDDAIFSRDREALQIIYVDATQGWVITSVADQGATQALYISASGGTETTSGDYKIHTFTSTGTFTVSSVGNAAGSNTVDYMVVAAGGGGGASAAPGGGGGGGGGGGWRASSGTASGSYTAGPGPLTSPVSALPVSAQGYPITIGAGGSGAAGAPSCGSTIATNGANSVFSSVTSAGGGKGGINSSPQQAGGPGGSGGGSSWQTRTGGTGNTPPVSPPQGNDGGNGSSAPTYQGGPGGGAAGAGTDLPWPTGNEGASGGVGAVSHISGSPVGYAGGGGGGGSTNPQGASGGAASPDGSGGAGAGPGTPSLNGSAGATNRGGGGGSGGSGSPDSTNGGAGGSGVVVIRYKYQN